MTASTVNVHPEPERFFRKRNLRTFRETIRNCFDDTVSNNDRAQAPAAALIQIRKRLPEDLGTRLNSSRKFATHGTRQQFNFEICDRAQNGVLDRIHFKYCIAYDFHLLNDGRHDGFFHLWLKRSAFTKIETISGLCLKKHALMSMSATCE